MDLQDSMGEGGDCGIGGREDFLWVWRIWKILTCPLFTQMWVFFIIEENHRGFLSEDITQTCPNCYLVKVFLQSCWYVSQSTPEASLHFNRPSLVLSYFWFNLAFVTNYRASYKKESICSISWASILVGVASLFTSSLRLQFIYFVYVDLFF